MISAQQIRKQAKQNAIGQNGFAEHMGGHLSDLQEPHIRFFDVSRRKREVRISIQVFYGIGVHHYATLREQDNPIWHPIKQAWWRPWEDYKGAGSCISRQCNTYEEADKFIRRVMRWVFPKHKAIRNDATGRRWFYNRDGD